MKRLNISEFRRSFSALTEPVEVLRGVDTIGVYYPTGTDTPQTRTDAAHSWAVLPKTIVEAPFRPAPKPKK